MIPSPRMIQANHAIRSLQIFECLSQYRPTFVGSTPIDIDLDESDLDIICEAHNLDQFEEQNRLLYGSRTNFRSMRAVKYGLPCILISFYSHSFRIGIFGQPKAIEEQ